MSLSLLDPLLVRWRALHGNTRGAIWLLIAGFITTVQGAVVKVVGPEMHTFQVVFLRCAFGASILNPFAIGRGLMNMATGRLRLHVARAMISVMSMGCSFYALARLPLADAVAYAFTVPLFMIPLAVLLLSEPVRWRRWTATGVGFLGVLVMADPTGAIDEAIPVALLSALFTALVYIVVKRLSETEPVLTVLTYFSVLGATLSLGPALAVWMDPSADQLGLLFLVGLTGTLSQLFAVRAWIVAEATAVAPFDYSRLLYAAILGALFFGEIPGWNTALGATIIVAATLYIARREALLRRKAATEKPGEPAS